MRLGDYTYSHGELYGGLDVAVRLTWTRLVPYRPATWWDPPEGGHVEDLEAHALAGPSTGPTLNAIPITEAEAGARQWERWELLAYEYAREDIDE